MRLLNFNIRQNNTRGTGCNIPQLFCILFQNYFVLLIGPKIILKYSSSIFLHDSYMKVISWPYLPDITTERYFDGYNFFTR